MTEIVKGFRLEKAQPEEVKSYQSLLNEGSVILLNRGIGLTTLTKILKVQIGRPEFDNVLADLAIKLFLVGSKSNYYIGSRRSINRHNIHRRADDIDDETFHRLREKLLAVFVIRQRSKPAVESFVKENKNFVDVLRGADFRQILSETEENKSLIRDYYCALLHQVYDKRYHSKSALISTSINEEVATRFIGPEGILIKYFIPQALVHTLTIPPYILSESPAKNILKRLNLPMVVNPPFVEQSEYSVRRALFPHFIASFSYINGNYTRTILNPEMVNYSQNTLREGFNINQEHFFDVVKDTEFSRQGELVNNRQFREV